MLTSAVLMAVMSLSQGFKPNNYAVFGATGGTGERVVKQLLEQENAVVKTLSRNQSSKWPWLSAQDEATAARVKSFQGSVTQFKDVEQLFEDDIDGVVIALGGQTNQVGKDMLTEGTQNIIKCMKDKGVERVSVVTSVGVGDSLEQAPWIFRFFMETVLKDGMIDKEHQEALFMDGPGKDLEWTIVRPSGLTDDFGTREIWRIKGKASQISRDDVAAVCVRALGDNWPYSKQALCIANQGEPGDDLLELN